VVLLNGYNYTYTSVPRLVDGQPHLYIIRANASRTSIDTDVGGDFRATGLGALPSTGATAGIGWNYGFNEGESGQYGEAASWNRVLTDDEVTSLIFSWKGEVVKPFTPKARFWRIYITATEANDGYVNVSQLALRATPNGYNQGSLSGGSATESSVYGGYTSYGCFKDVGGFWYSNSQAAPWWAAYDFGVGIERAVAEIAITGVNVAGRQPKDFQIQISSDGTTWTTVATYTGVTGWALGIERTFAIPN
jgi:hypothetical protein